MADRVVKVRLSADIAQYKQAMEEAAAAAKKAADDSKKASETSSEMSKKEAAEARKKGQEVAQASRAEAKAAQEAARQAKEKLDAWKSLGTTLMGVGAAMTALTVSVAKTGVEYNTLQQTTRAALATLLGGAKQANAQMDKLDAFARTSPFSKTVFISAQQQMLGFGVAAKDVIPALDAIQNAVAAMGGSNDQIRALAEIMSRIKSEGRLSGDALQRLGYYGIDAAQIIGSQMGKTAVEIRDMASKPGGIPVEQIWNPLVQGLQEKFGGAADNVKLTFAGAMDRVRAAWRDLSADLTKPLVDPNGGGLFVDLLNRLADVLRMFQALPEPVKLAGGALFALIGVTATVTGAAIVAKLKWMEFAATLDKLGPMGSRVKGVLGGIGSFLTGPWGLALAAAAGGLLFFMQKQAEAKQRAEAFAGSLDKVTGALSEQTRELAKQDLANRSQVLWWADASIYDSAQRFGVSLEDVTDAALGSEEALARVNAQIDKHMATVEGDSRTMKGWRESADRVRDGIARVNGELENGIEINKQKAAADGEVADSSGQVVGAFEEQEEASKELLEALRGVIDAYEHLAHGQMSLSEAHDKALASVNKMRDAAEAEGAALDGTNEASIKLRDSIRDVEKSHYDSAKAIVENGGTLASARTEWQRGRDAVIKMLEAKGMDTAAATRWADKNLGSAKDVQLALAAVKDQADKLPDKKTIKTELVGDEVLKTRLANLKARLASIPSVKRITLESYEVGNRKVSSNAEGGLYQNQVKAFAAGGMEPGIYPFTAGGIHKFAEEYAEAYISLDPARRGRSEQVWQRVGSEAGFSQPRASEQRPVVVNMTVNPQPGMSEGQVGSIAANKIENALRGA